MKQTFWRLGFLVILVALLLFLGQPTSAGTFRTENSLEVEKALSVGLETSSATESQPDVKIWLADYSTSNPVEALVLSSGGAATIALSGSSVRANASSDDMIAYYLTADRRVWNTMDGGLSFTPSTSFDAILASSDPLSEGTPIDIFTDPNDPYSVGVLVDNGDLSPQCNEANNWIRVYRSPDGGNTWAYSQVIDNGDYCLRRTFRGMAMGNVIYVGGVGEGTQPYGEWHGVIYGSTDGGANWSRTWHNDLIQGVGAWDQSGISTITTPINGSGSVWYAGIKGGASGGLRFHGILRGSGSSWSYKPIEGCSGCFASNQTVYVSDVAVDATNENIVLALVVGYGLYRSNDGGNTWV